MTARTPSVIRSNVGSLQFNNQVNEVKQLILQTSDLADAGDTLTIYTTTYGITNIVGVLGFKHTTNNQVIVTENPTTALSGTSFTITVPAGTNNDKRVYLLFYQ